MRSGPDSILGRPWLHFGAALTPFWGGFSRVMGLIFSSRFSSFLLILSSVRGEGCTIITSIKSCFRQDRHADLVNYPFNNFSCLLEVSQNNRSLLFLIFSWQRAQSMLSWIGSAARTCAATRTCATLFFGWWGSSLLSTRTCATLHLSWWRSSLL